MPKEILKAFKYKHYFVIIPAGESEETFDNYIVFDEKTKKKVNLNIFDLEDFGDLAEEIDPKSFVS